MAQTVLVAEDDRDIVELLTLYLTGSGYRVLAAPDGSAALELVRANDVDIALVDIMMPNMNGYDFIKALRQASSIPVIIMSARTQSADKIVGFDAGADGYIAKPFDPLEVCAYIRALLRRCSETGIRGSESGDGRRDSDDHCIRLGDLAFDTERLTLTRGGTPVSLTAAETKIVVALMRAPGRVFSKAQLYECISGDSYAGSEGSVMVHISNIRAKLEDDPLRPRYIKTVRGMGYRLEG